MKKNLAVFLSLMLASVLAEAKTIVIYHTSDIHGWYFARPAASEGELAKKYIGGFPALSALVKKEKLPHILLDSGDTFVGTPVGNYTRGRATVALFNKLGYSAATLGNHEFDYGAVVPKAMAATAKYPYLASNLYLKKTGKVAPFVKPYTIIKKDGVRIGVIGAITEETATATLPRNVIDFTFRDKNETVRGAVEALKKEKVNAIVVITHSGLCADCSGKTLKQSEIKLTDADYKDGNISMARAAKGDIAVIMGGHNHTALADGYRDAESGTLLVESGAQLTAASRVELNFDDRTGKFTGAKDELVDLWTDKDGGDKKVAAVLAKYQKEVAGRMARKVAHTSFDLTRGDEKFSPAFCNLVSDYMMKIASGSVAAFQNLHGVRSDIPKGDITYGEIYQALPFENSLYELDMTGAQIADVISQTVTGETSANCVGGLKAVYTLTADNKIGSLTVTVGGQPLDMNKTYRVVTNNFLAEGGSGGKVISKGTNKTDLDINIRDAIAAEMEKTGEITLPEGGRIVKSDK